MADEQAPLSVNSKQGESPGAVQLASDGGDLPGRRLPDHLDGVVLRRGVLELEEALHLLQPPPHPGPVLAGDAPHQLDQEALLQSVGGVDEDAELGVVEDVLVRQLDFIADDDGDAVAGDGVEQAIGRRGVPCDVQTELGGAHAPARSADAVSTGRPEGEVDVFLILEKIKELLPDEPALRTETQIRPGKGRRSSIHHTEGDRAGSVDCVLPPSRNHNFFLF